MIEEMNIQLNGMDLLSFRDHNILIYAFHINIIQEVLKQVFLFILLVKILKNINPSGTCNFSRIDNAHIKFTMNGQGVGDKVMRVYAVNYNILVIEGGQAV